jgi:sugar phosphate permease
MPRTSEPATTDPRAGWKVIAALSLGYVGVYLCRKNLSVAVPLLQDAFGATKQEVGQIASVGTLAYAIGKIVNGPIVDRLGGRTGFLVALCSVALFGAAGALAPGLAVLALLYGLNRFAGSAAWGAMLKLVPTWFGTARAATVIGVLSLSYVAGGVAATLLARQILQGGGGWRSVMGAPSVLVLLIAVLVATAVRSGPLHPPPPRTAAPSALARRLAFLELFRRPQFLVVCALSFTITLMRESFNNWSVDFLTSIQGGTKSVATAALQSVGFDLAGAVAIFVTGVAYDRVPPERRRWFLAGNLALLAAVLAALPRAVLASPNAGPALVGLVGLLVYGPFSLLSGVMALESGGARLAASAAGITDGVGYLAGVLAGGMLGKLLDVGGYSLGFGCLAGLTLISALVALGVRPAPSEALEAGRPPGPDH